MQDNECIKRLTDEILFLSFRKDECYGEIVSISIRFDIYHMIKNTAIQIVLQYVSDISRWFYIPFHWYWIDGCLWYSIWSMQKKKKIQQLAIWYPATFFQGKPILAAAIVVKKCRRCFKFMSLFVVWKNMKLLYT